MTPACQILRRKNISPLLFLYYSPPLSLSPTHCFSNLRSFYINSLWSFSCFVSCSSYIIKYLFSQLNCVILSQVYLWTMLKHCLISYIHSFVPLSAHDQIRFRGVLLEWAVICCCCPSIVLTHCWCCCCGDNDNDDGDDNDNSSEDGLLFVSLRAHRALINVWIPSVFLQGRAANAYHVYQVHSVTLMSVCAASSVYQVVITWRRIA